MKIFVRNDIKINESVSFAVVTHSIVLYQTLQRAFKIIIDILPFLAV
jgi:hypothetical protein